MVIDFLVYDLKRLRIEDDDGRLGDGGDAKLWNEDWVQHSVGWLVKSYVNRDTMPFFRENVQSLNFEITFMIQ